MHQSQSVSIFLLLYLNNSFSFHFLDSNISTLNSIQEEVSQSLDDREEHFDRKVLSPTVNVFDGNTNTDVLKGNSLSEASATASTKKGFYFRTTTESRINHLVLKV